MPRQRLPPWLAIAALTAIILAVIYSYTTDGSSATRPSYHRA